MAGFAYPITLDISAFRCIIIGAGRVGVRKAVGLLHGGAGKIVAIAPEIHAEMPSAVERVEARYEPGHLKGAHLVFAATNDAAVNEQVINDAKQRGILANRTDGGQGTGGDFNVPATQRNGGLLMSITADGHPALASYVRDQLRDAIDPAWVKMEQMLDTIRPMIKARVNDRERRRTMLRLLLSDHGFKLAEHQSPEALFDWAWRMTGEGR